MYNVQFQNYSEQLFQIWTYSSLSVAQNGQFLIDWYDLKQKLLL